MHEGKPAAGRLAGGIIEILDNRPRKGDKTSMLAPAFTRENAADFARKAVASREANRRTRMLAVEQAAKRPDIEFEVHRIRQAMRKLPVTSDIYGELVNRLDRLWDKAFPRQGTAKPSRQRGSPSIEPLPTPQEQTPPAGQSGV